MASSSTGTRRLAGLQLFPETVFTRTYQGGCQCVCQTFLFLLMVRNARILCARSCVVLHLTTLQHSLLFCSLSKQRGNLRSLLHRCPNQDSKTDSASRQIRMICAVGVLCSGRTPAEMFRIRKYITVSRKSERTMESGLNPRRIEPPCLLALMQL